MRQCSSKAVLVCFLPRVAVVLSPNQPPNIDAAFCAADSKLVVRHEAHGCDAAA